MHFGQWNLYINGKYCDYCWLIRQVWNRARVHLTSTECEMAIKLACWRLSWSSGTINLYCVRVWLQDSVNLIMVFYDMNLYDSFYVCFRVLTTVVLGQTNHLAVTYSTLITKLAYMPELTSVVHKWGGYAWPGSPLILLYLCCVSYNVSHC